MTPDLRGLMPEELRALLPDAPAYRATQLFLWLQKGVASVDEMTNIPLSLRRDLLAAGRLIHPTVRRRRIAPDGTLKLLWQFEDGQCVESVALTYHHGLSVCISTQAGCRQGCVFCASALGGLVRNLTAGEMLAQVTGAAREVGAAANHVVLMGTGEPLDNFDEVVRFLRLLSHPDGMGMSLRHVSLSTCGLVPGIDALAELCLPVTLSVSLHAPDDETRARLMPSHGDMETLLRACRRYFKRTGRRVSYEYILLRGVNDAPAQAHRLGALLRGVPAHVNLIPYNPARGDALAPSTSETARIFGETVASYGVAVTRRRRLGAEIDAACGQLRRQAAAP